MLKLLILLLGVSWGADVKDPILRPPQQTISTRPVCASPYGCVAYNSELQVFEGFTGISWDPFNGEIIIVEDNLVSTATTDALSANQGRVLNDLISGHESDLTNLQLIAHNHANKILLDSLISTGTANQFLSADGTYKVPIDLNTIVLVEDSLVSTSTINALSANQGRILDEKILLNTADIAAANSAIGVNAADIVSANTAIGINASAIATNTADISINSDAIAANTSDISSNVTAIVGLDGRVGSLETDTHTHANKALLDTLSSVGLATEFLSADGTYKVPIDLNTVTVVEDLLTSTSAVNALSANQGRILNEKILLNTTDIASANTAIATNAADIAGNAAAIATNTADISINAAAINTNAVNIASNSAAIATNTTNIAINAQAIAGLDGRVDQNVSDIASNAAAIATNTTDIATNVSAIAGLDDRIIPLETDTHTHANKVLLDTLTSAGLATTFLSGNGTYIDPIDVEDLLTSNSPITALSANQGRILNEKILLNDAAIANNAAAITTNTTDIAALDGRIIPLEADTHTHANKILLDSLTSIGTPTDFLSADGTYKLPIALTEWVAGKDYKVGEIVNGGLDNNWLLKVIKDHTSIDLPLDADNGNLLALSPPLLTTGVQIGGEVSLVGTTATVQSGKGYTALYHDTPSPFPTLKMVDWTTQNITVPATGVHSLYIDVDGVLHSMAGYIDSNTATNNIGVGFVDMNLGIVANRKTYPTNPIGQLRSLAFFFGGMTKGLAYQATGLQLARSAHEIFFWGADTTDPYNPNTKIEPALNPQTFYEYTQTGPINPTPTTILRNAVYDLNGTLVPMSNNKWGFIRIFSTLETDDHIMYSQAEYFTEADARNAAIAANFVRPVDLTYTKFSSWMVFEKGDADFSNNPITTCEPFGCDKVGSSASGGGDVFGPGISTPSDVAIFSDVSGKLISDSGILASDIVHTNRALLDSLTSTGTPTEFLAADGNYKLPIALTTWEAGKAYKAGEMVNSGSDGNWLFKVIQDHTSVDVPFDFRTGRIMAIAPPIITTGVQDGGQVSIAGNLATIQGGTGYIAKYGTSPSAWPLVTIVEWTTQNITVPSTGIHALYIDEDGTLILGAPTADPVDTRATQDDTISVAIVDMNLGLIYDRKTYPTNPVGQLRGLSFFLGVMTKGLAYVATGLQLARSQHDVYFWGADPFNPFNPNQKTVAALPIADFYEFDQDGAVLPAVRITTLKNTIYDNNGNQTAMTNNRWTFIRIYSSPGSDNYVMYGQGQWQTEAEAKEAATSRNFIRPADLELTKFSAWFTFIKGDNDFSDNIITVCEPFGCDKIGSTAGGGAGGIGDVIGPVSAVIDNIPTFADASGKVLKDSGIPISAVTAPAVMSAEIEKQNKIIEDLINRVKALEDKIK